MKFMNEFEIDASCDRRRDHPILGPATQTLSNLRDCANDNSDGWPYWSQPARAARKLMELIDGDCSWDARYGPRDDVTEAQLKAAYSPIKAFLTRTGLKCELVQPA